MREQCGKLRKATVAERNRILHAYFPRPGRMYQMPSMFKEDVLEVSARLHVITRGVSIFHTDVMKFQNLLIKLMQLALLICIIQLSLFCMYLFSESVD